MFSAAGFVAIGYSAIEKTITGTKGLALAPLLLLGPPFLVGGEVRKQEGNRALTSSSFSQ